MNHQLIERLQNFTLDRKILSVDSNDRNILKWPSSSEFEVSCPQNYTNVESIRLVTLQCPNIFYNISEYLQNNKLLVDVSSSKDVITIEDGFYDVNKLVNALKNALNSQSSSPNFEVTYNDLNKKIYIGNTTNNFKLIFNHSPGEITYDKCNNNININSKVYTYNNIYEQHSKWGLGALLGFDKKTYTSEPGLTRFQHQPLSTVDWISNGNNILEAPSILDLDDYQYIYIELEKLNNGDEIKPFINDKINSTNNGIMNAFFAKIPIIKSNFNQSINNKECYIEGITYNQPPLDRISKLKFRFRYHNGMLVDFQNFNVSLTLEINQIRNELKDYNVRTPFKL